MTLTEAKDILKNNGFLVESVRLVNNLDQFVELLSNCVGEIPGDEVVFKAAMNQPYYTLRLRNSGKKVAEITYNLSNLWWWHDVKGIAVTVYDVDMNKTRNEYDFDELTLEKIKEIGGTIRAAAVKVKEGI